MKYLKKHNIFENRSGRIQEFYNNLLDSKLTLTELIDNNDIISDVFGGGFNVLQLLILYRYSDDIKIETLKYIDIDKKMIGGTILYGSKHISAIGMSAIFVASVKGYLDDVMLLLDAGADCNIIDSHGKYFYDYMKNGEEWFKKTYSEKYFDFLKKKNVKRFNL